MKGITACFTGHRNIPPEYRDFIQGQLYTEVTGLIGQGYQYFVAGGALGFDTMAAQTVLLLKREHPQIRLILALPCLNQTRGWPAKEIALYQSILEQADKAIFTSQEYTRGCMFKRNRYLVDHSNVCICYQTENRGGTAYTVQYALSQGIRVINLAPPEQY